jgi:aldehyde dehydrogenase (NAD+)
MEIEYGSLLASQRAFFATNKTKDIDFRIEHLKKLRASITSHTSKIVEASVADAHESITGALYKDLHKPEMEAYSTEIGFCLSEITHVINKLRKWAKPVKVRGPLFFPLTRAYIQYEPLGVVLIISPWNYPFQLTISPLVGAIASGNCAIVKPSRLAPHTAGIIKEIADECFSPEYITVLMGGVGTNEKLLAQKYDYIFFTGGSETGKIIMQSAAANLTPTTLEMGGKSPCIVDENIDLEKTARRITWGKFLNTGQTCIAPDHLFVHENVKAKLVEAMKKAIVDFYGIDIKNNPDYGRIIDERHFQRISSYLGDGQTVVGGQTDAGDLYIAPTLLDNVSKESKIMGEEIFGPVLPILTYSDIGEVVAFINKGAKPLALYVFSNSKSVQDRVLKETSSGGVCINDVIIHISATELPFGGVGGSGFGRYHSRASFETLSNRKGVLIQHNLFDLNVRYPPYKPSLLKMLKMIMK